MIFRAKSPRDGWAYAKSEHTSLRQIDHGEDDGGRLRVDFTRLRRVSAHLSKRTCERKFFFGKAWVHDNLCFALIMTGPITGTGPPSDAWANCRRSKPVHREPSLYQLLRVVVPRVFSTAWFFPKLEEFNFSMCGCWE